MKIGIPNFLRRNYVATHCGHRTKQQGAVTALGDTTTIQMPRNNAGSVDWCLECIGRMSIQCAWCENIIFIGEPITLYSPDEDFIIPEHAVVFSEDPLQLVGCLGRDCAHSGADRVGFWVPDEYGKGNVHRVPSPIEILIGENFNSAIFVSNIHDFEEAYNPKLFPLKK